MHKKQMPRLIWTKRKSPSDTSGLTLGIINIFFEYRGGYFDDKKIKETQVRKNNLLKFVSLYSKSRNFSDIL